MCEGEGRRGLPEEARAVLSKADATQPGASREEPLRRASSGEDTGPTLPAPRCPLGLCVLASLVN